MQKSEFQEDKKAYEEALVRSFIHPYKQARYLALLGKPKRRKELLQRLGHGQDINEACMIPLPADAQTADRVVEHLKQRGATMQCYLVSEKQDLDGRLLPLESAISQVYARGYGSVIYCLPKGVGYFEGEGTNERCILTPIAQAR